MAGGEQLLSFDTRRLNRGESNASFAFSSSILSINQNIRERNKNTAPKELENKKNSFQLFTREKTQIHFLLFLYLHLCL